MDDNACLREAVWSVMTGRVRRKGWLLAVVTGAGLLVGALRLGRPSPAAAFADKKEAGAELFATRGCAHCHGDDGQGTDKAPGLRELRKKLSADKIRDQIVHGGQGMPAFGDSLKDDEVDDLVSFLRAKKWVTPPAAAVQPAQTAKPAS